MQYVGFGWITLAVPAILVVAYLVIYPIRQMAAVVDGNPPLKENRRAKAIVIGVVGLVAGLLAQPEWERAQECKGADRPLFACMILDRAH